MLMFAIWTPLRLNLNSFRKCCETVGVLMFSWFLHVVCSFVFRLVVEDALFMLSELLFIVIFSRTFSGCTTVDIEEEHVF